MSFDTSDSRFSAIAACFTALFLLGLVSCSRAAELGAGPDPSPPKASVPAAKPPAASVGTHRFDYSVSREHSCSQSMESVTDSGRYELSIAEDGTATLTHDARHGVTFGPSYAKYKLGGASEFTHHDKESKATFKGRADAIDAGMQLTFEGGAIATCRESTLEANDGYTDAGPKTKRVKVLLCKKIPGAPEGLANAEKMKDGMPFAIPPGVRFHSSEFGFGTKHEGFEVQTGP